MTPPELLQIAALLQICNTLHIFIYL